MAGHIAAGSEDVALGHDGTAVGELHIDRGEGPHAVFNKPSGSSGAVDQHRKLILGTVTARGVT